jgi:hypothetical protein
VDTVEPHAVERLDDEEFLDYRTLNPLVLQAAAATMQIPVSELTDPRKGSWPVFPEKKTDELLRLLGDSLPRQPECSYPRAGTAQAVEYAAAVVDCESFVGPWWYRHANRKNDGVRLSVTIAQNHRDLLELVRRIVGAHGGIYTLKRTASQNRPNYTLRYDGVHALCALACVYPYLYRKREQAQVMVRMFIDGRLWEHVGCRGVAPHIRKIRKRYVRKLQKMH